ncbi:hypothetical protein [Mycobacterium sp.]|uniref:hypothetical protein n=1 Tax=Mycobacterium sp. TaxID=1785 RepID=UPI0011F61D3E|nr:hypothetical protein [Mycobacterium sp.]TAM67187.1 MAG: hypothetical protein EPN51_14430 [Mycobacterium sp.]
MTDATVAIAGTSAMIEKHQRLCVWAGLAFVPVFGAVFIFMGWLPPPSPNLGAAEIGQIFGEDRTRIRIGMYLLTFVAPLLAFFGAALTHQCRMIVGNSPLVWVQALSAAVLMLEFLIPQMVWQTALFRTGRAPEMVQMLNDQAWLLYLGVVGTVMVQLIVLAICIFHDPRTEPLIPRWAAYLCLWVTLGVSAGGLIVFAHTGPIAWNGIISWWIVVISFFVWIASMSTLMIRASHRVEGELAVRVTTQG